MTTPLESDERGLRYVLRVLWRYKLIVVVAFAVVLGTALYISSQQPPTYEASSEMLLQRLTTEQLLDPNLAPDRGVQGIDTEVALLESTATSDAVEAALGYEPEIEVEVVGSSDIVTITATDDDPERAAEAANVYARTYAERRQADVLADLNRAIAEVDARLTAAEAELAALEQPLADLDAQIAATIDEDLLARLSGDRQRLQSRLSAALSSAARQRDTYLDELNRLGLAANLTRTGGAQIVNEASVPTEETGAGPVQTGVLFGIVGLLFGIGLAFLFERLDDTTKTREDLRRAVPGVPVLGLLPRRRSGDQLVASSDPHAPATEAYRSLRTSLQFLQIDKELTVIQVTSPGSSEGKTTTVANLAVTLAWTNLRVIVVGFDLRRPALHQCFGLANDLGVSSVLIGDVPLDEALQRPAGVGGDLRVLTSGPVPPNPAELLGSERTKDLVRALRERADVVLLDCPPVLPVTDALVLADVVDATILVASAGGTRGKDLRQAAENLRGVGAPLAGTVLNRVPQGETAYGGYVAAGTDDAVGKDMAVDPARRGTVAFKVDSGARPSSPSRSRELRE